jgi:hypothetical protein
MQTLRFGFVLGAAMVLGCGPSIDLVSVMAGQGATASAPLSLATVRDARQSEAIGYGRHEWLRLGYEVDTDADLAAWLGSHLRVSLGAHAHGAPPPAGVVDVTVHRFDIEESTWARGVADLGVRVRWRDGGLSSHRLTVVTTELMTDDDAGAWTVAAGHLAGHASEEVARWARAEGLQRQPPEL